MLIGEYLHTLDPKKRLSMPAKFRKELGKKVVVTRGLDKCLFVYTLAEWKRVAEKIAEMSMGQADSRGFNRFLLSGAVETDVDAGGRMDGINTRDRLKSRQMHWQRSLER